MAEVGKNSQLKNLKLKCWLAVISIPTNYNGHVFGLILQNLLIPLLINYSCTHFSVLVSQLRYIPSRNEHAASIVGEILNRQKTAKKRLEGEKNERSKEK